MSLQIRRGPNSDRATITPLEGELLYTTDTKQVYIGDGFTLGGNPVSSGSFSLGGQVASDIYLNTKKIISASGIYINGVTGNIGANGFYGLINGSLGSNLNLNNRQITNGLNLTIDGNNGNISAGQVTGTIKAVDGTIRVDANTNHISNGTIDITNATITSSTNAILIQNSRLDINNSGNVMRITGTTTGLDPNTSNHIETRTSRGTVSSPTAVIPGDIVFSLISEGWDGSSYIGGGAIAMSVDSVAPGNVPLSVGLYSVNNGLAVGATIHSNGDLSISQGMRCISLPAAPSNPIDGTIYVADGVSWDPSSKANNRPYPVFYDGVDYIALY